MLNRWLFFAFILCCVFVYSFLTFSVYRIKAAVEKKSKVTEDYVNRQIQYRILPGGAYYKSLAESLQAYPHKPETVERAYRKAVMKSPADHNIWHAYAYYLVGRRCCGERVMELFSGILKRAKMKPDTYLAAGIYLLETGHEKEGLDEIQRGLELDPHTGRKIYSTLQAKGFSGEDLIQITPKRADALIELSHYLKSKGKQEKENLVRVLQIASRVALDEQQRLILAKDALQIGLLSLAKQQAVLIQGPSQSQAQKFQLLADIAAAENDWSQYSRFTSLALKNFKEAGEQKKGVRYAIQVVLKRSKMDPPDQTKKRLEQVIQDFPDFGDGYYHLSRWTEKESPDISLKYLEKAVEIEPDNFIYADVLANRYIQLSRFSEAEKIYESFVDDPRYQNKAYLMLAQTKLRAGKSTEASSIMEKAQRGSRSRRLILELAKLRESMGDYRQAAQAYEELAELNPDEIGPYVMAGNAYEKAGDFKAAQERYRQALEIDPGNPRVVRALKKLEMNQHKQ
jgi:tetratricopeptide (TPR) repeat protein